MFGHFLAGSLHAHLPVRDGERLTYRVSWAVVPGAGEIKISAHKETAAGGERLLVTTTTATRRLARMLLPFDAESRSVFDLKTGRLISLHETSTQREKRSEHQVTFDYAAKQATYLGSKSEGEARLLPMPAGDPSDLIMGLLQTRTWNLALGEKQDALVLFTNDFYELTIYHTRQEEVRTPLGTFQTKVLEPRMEKSAPKGMFKRGSTVRVWISDDERRLPVRFEVEFKIGTGTATLVGYEGPGAPAAQPHAKDPRP
jgi:hypothetical protein